MDIQRRSLIDASPKETIIRTKRKGGKIFIFLSFILLLAAAGLGFGTYYFYDKYQELKDNPELAAQEESDILIEKVGTLMDLPTDEEPTIATVLDKDQLADQEFFKNAKNGDKLLAYVGAKKAILYRPSTNKIIEVAPIYITSEEDTTSDETTVEEEDTTDTTTTDDTITQPEE